VKVGKEKSSGQGKLRLGGEGNGLEEEEGERYGPIVATGKSGPGLGSMASAARGDCFNTEPCCCWQPHIAICPSHHC
jgi:hypothetical protein